MKRKIGKMFEGSLEKTYNEVVISDSEVVVPRGWIEKLIARKKKVLVGKEIRLGYLNGLLGHIESAEQFISSPDQDV